MAARSNLPIAWRRDHLYLLVKTQHDSFLVDVGDDPAIAQAELAQAKELMNETGSVTIGGSLVVMASDIESIALQDSGEPSGLI